MARRRGKGDGAVSIESVRVSIDPGATRELLREADPYLLDCSSTIGKSILAAVPVVRGVVKQSYRMTTEKAEPGEARLYVGSPFWHWLEYGTRTSPVYRPVQRGVEASGARWEPA
jgi:hypothetical protein